MEEKTSGARGVVLGSLAAAGAYLVLDLPPRSISLGRGGFYLVIPVYDAAGRLGEPLHPLHARGAAAAAMYARWLL